MIYSILYFFR